ncbi:hypothetical protein ACFQVD_35940 [Streptosporangium amethystogenes subsp. fukuiense]|uniref:Glyoxalase n=1 Tax=Streptosporangium amethystogenes subsp. fukuiense TaxID=698418 RepID=A0ABW2TA66_9ACTN
MRPTWRCLHHLLPARAEQLAGGERHYAAYLEDADGFEVELVAPGTSRQD